MTGTIRALLAIVPLTGCAAPAPAPATLDQDIARITREIEATCLGSGLFKLMGAQALDAAVDVVCARPDLFAGDVASIEWLMREIRQRRLTPRQ